MAQDVSRLTGCESPLLLNLARGFHWQELIDEGAYPNIKELAKAIGIDSGVVAKASFPIVWRKQEEELL